MTYAIDTNIIIKYLRNEPNVCRNFDSAIMRRDDIFIPKVVDYEIRRGFRILSAPKKEASYKILVCGGICDVAEMDVYCWERAEIIYEELYRKGYTVDEMDILIAATCLENDYTLVTNNIKDFQNIDGLIIENWV